jgi:hypothetical protein
MGLEGLAMRTSPFRNFAAAVSLALLGLLAAPERGEAAAFCQGLASTATRGDNDISDNPGGFTCTAVASTLNVATFPGSGGAYGSVSPGVLRTQTSAASSDNRGEGSFVLTQVVTDYRDTITVGGLGPDGALLTFKVGIDGLMDASGNPEVTSASSFSFTGSLGNRARVSGANRVFQACVDNQPPPAPTCNAAFDVSADDYAVINALVTLSVYAFNGDVIDLVLAQRSSSRQIVTVDGTAGSSQALFLHTTDWRGLDVTDANRSVTLTSLSGFDYRNAALPQGVPEPATWALMILGFGAAGSALRRRKAVVA